MSELMDFASVPYHILTPKDAKPIVQVVQDTMLGSYRITQPYTAIHDKAFANLQMVNSYFTGALPAPASGRYFSGRQAFSGILPPGLFLNAGNKQGGRVTIHNSEIVGGAGAKDGLVDKDVYNAMSRGLIPVLYHDYGPFEVRRFLDNIQRLVCRWLLTGGFSVGISDLVVGDHVNDELRKLAGSIKADTTAILHKALRGELDNTSMFNNQEFFEREIGNILNDANNKAGKIGLQTIDDRTNRLINMVKSGAKGKDLNVTQMVAALGQQMIDGKRVAYGFTDRTLPHFCKYDDGLESRGYVESSFIKGLTPVEMFFHAMGGREGLIDTAVKSVTGDTPVMVIEDGVPKTVRIGDWIDAHLAARPESVKHYDARNLEMLYLDRVVHIPTVDADGNMTWGELTAVTRHDPGTQLYKVTTEGGRDVIVTESKSLIVWNGSQFIEKPTPEVVVGDFLPVTVSLPEPPVVVESVDMATYFPKTHYIHGTDYNKAVAAMRKAQGTNRFIPLVKGSSWWAQNNGTTFVLPYPSKARLQRATVRNNNDNIIDGCVYPYQASRESARIPDRFDLDYDNGTFIGLYLADGCTHEHSGTVSIAKEDESVLNFAMDWFDKFSITHRIDRTESKLGTSTSLIGNSTLLARFLDAFVGHGARNKFVPDVAFVAPLEFVRGILSGYFSGDGYIRDGGVIANSASRRLIDGISMLCSRLGIFGKIATTQQMSNNVGTVDIAPSHNISIRAQWARKFAKEITLIMDRKNETLHTMRITETHRNFKEHNDVVMDPIKSITVIGVDAYPKVYDVTVPSTLNFSLQNGLVCRDTSDTGYTQRRLVKAMEDAKIYYDNTVRNAAGSVIQFLYGEDGMEGTKIEKQTVPTVNKNVFEMDRDYHLRTVDNLELHMTPEAFEAMKKEDWQAACGEHFEQLMVDREVLVEQIQGRRKEDKVLYPIPFERILKSATERMRAARLDGLPADITPGAILAEIQRLEDELYVTQPGQATFFLRMLLRIYLSPKPLILKHHMKREVFEWIVGEVRRYFKEAVAPAGEMVGIIAAQSIGEVQTQLTLDSFHVSGTAAAVKATSGVPRVKELMSVSKNIKTPTMLIYLKPDVGTVVGAEESDDGTVTGDARVKEAKKRAMDVLRSLEITTIENVIDGTEIYYDPAGDDGFATAIPGDAGFLETYRAFGAAAGAAAGAVSPWVLRIRVNKDKLHASHVTMTELHLRLHAAYNAMVDLMFTDDNAPELVLRARLVDHPKDDAVAGLKALEQSLVNRPIKGVERIRKVSMHPQTMELYNSATQGFDKVTEWVLDTDGSNFIEILSNPNVDATRTISNDPREIYAVLGIEAARNSLHNEIMEVIRGSSVNFRHVSLLVDTMTHRGTMMSIDRHGINRGDVGPLAKSSFEETTDMLIKASVFAEYDKINGVSANIMLGQLPPCGTGNSEILLDEDAYIAAIRGKLKPVPEEAEDAPAAPDGPDPCALSGIHFHYAAPQRMDVGRSYELPAI